MRTTIGVTSLSGLLAVAAIALGSPRQASAQGTIALGTCVAGGATRLTFSPGLGTLPQAQALEVSTILTNCNFGLGLAPATFSWSGTLPSGSCFSLSTQIPASATGGTLLWNDGKTKSTVQFTSLVYAGIAGVVPATMTYAITGGYQKGGTFIVVEAFAPALNQLTCSTLAPVTVLTGNLLNATFSNISL